MKKKKMRGLKYDKGVRLRMKRKRYKIKRGSRRAGTVLQAANKVRQVRLA
jgi:hypothetical protein